MPDDLIKPPCGFDGQVDTLEGVNKGALPFVGNAIDISGNNDDAVNDCDFDEDEMGDECIHAVNYKLVGKENDSL